jgi:tetratricopeptide (TPR) repeat protein
MLLHLTGQYDKSTEVLSKAEERAKELYTVSISKNIKAALTSDAQKDYEGEDYENVLVFVVKALNFLAQNKVEGALIEARKINEKLALYNTKYKGKFVYNQDAFAHWLTGLLYELEKSYDDARISYVKAVEVYKKDFAANYASRLPSYLGEDVARAAMLTNDKELFEKAKAELGGTGASLAALKTGGEIVLIHFNGEGPSKTDYFISCNFQSATNWGCDGEPGGEFMTKKTITLSTGTAMKVAFPQLIIKEPVNPYVVMRVGGASAQAEEALPISRIAIKVLRDKTGRIFRDAVIRVITKMLLSKAGEAAAEKVGGAGLGFLAKVGAQAASQATEEADKRAWITLPSRIEVARAIVPPGVYTVALSLPRTSYIPRPIQNVKVEAGKRVIISHYTIP